MTITKTIALILVVALLTATLSACGSTPAPATSASASSSSSESESAAEPPPQEMVAAPREYAKGTKTDTSYTSEFWGLQFVAPNDNIMIANDEQIAEIMGIGVEALGTDPELAEQFKAAIEQYEMVAMDLKYGAVLMVIFEELPVSFMTPELYISGVKQNFEKIGENVTIEFDNDGNTTSETIGGKHFTSVSYTMTSEGTPPNKQKQCVLIDGKRVLIVSLAYPPELEGAKETAEAMFGALTALESQDDEQSGSEAE